MSVAPSMNTTPQCGARLSAGWIANALEGEILRGSPLDVIQGVSSDTRALKPEELFVALRGEHFDAHSFLDDATAAAGLIVDHQGLAQNKLPEADSFVVLVQDTGDALLALGEAYLSHIAPTVIAVTGSAGKTTTKDMIAALAGPKGVAATIGNFNNRIGLPLSILAAPATTEIFVAELGINANGEMDELAAVASPHVAVLTHVAEAHLEGLHSYENVLAEKMRIFAHLKASGSTAVLPHDLDIGAHKVLLQGHQSSTFGDSNEGSPDAAPIGIAWDGKAQIGKVRVGETHYSISLPLPGRHNLRNLLAALAAIKAIGVEPNLSALASLEPSAHRSKLLEISGVRILDDAYNANPNSMEAALNTAVEIAHPGRIHAVLGSMFELGTDSEELHRKTGAAAGNIGLTSLIGFGADGGLIVQGALAENPALSCLVTADAQSAAEFMKARVQPGDLVLVKGSRGARTEAVIDAFASLSTKGQGV
jgi:UDP-N-acetylmuramoyl-tripeptide--D-alanyl-D-alanine ligase